MKMKKMINNTKIFSITKKIKMKKLCCVICGKYKKFKNPKISYIFEKALALSIICSSCKNEDEKYLKREESIEILKILGLTLNMLRMGSISSLPPPPPEGVKSFQKFHSNSLSISEDIKVFSLNIYHVH